MAGQNEAATTIAGTSESGRTRQRSTIAFPYTDLDSAIALATAIRDNVGHGVCDDDQLAAWSNQSPKSSTFRVQVYAARTFGILSGEGSRHELSALGQAVVDPHREREARARAFLTVPLFNAIYEQYRGTTLPPAAALERDIAALGVAEKQKSRARQVFERSAEQAGFFEHGKTRLVQPGVNPGADRQHHGKQQPKGAVGTSGGKGSGGDGDGGGGKKIDPILQGLIDRLPASGDIWPAAERKLWLQILESSFQLVYKDTDGN